MNISKKDKRSKVSFLEYSTYHFLGFVSGTSGCKRSKECLMQLQVVESPLHLGNSYLLWTTCGLFFLLGFNV